MISTPASAIRMRSRFDDCLMSKLEMTRLKNGSGAKLIARIADRYCPRQRLRPFQNEQDGDRHDPSEPHAPREREQQRQVRHHDTNHGHYTAHVVDPEHEEQRATRKQQAGKRHHMRRWSGDAMLEIVMTVEMQDTAQVHNLR